MAGANIKIGVTSSEFKKQMKEVNNQLKLMQSECALATSKASAFGSKTDQLKAKQNALKNSIASQNQTISLYESRITSINSTITKQTTEQAKLSQKIKETTQKYKESCTQTGKNSEESKKLDEEIKKLNEEYKKNEKSMQSNQQELNNLKIKLNNTKASLVDNEKALKDLDSQLKTVKWDEFGEKAQKVGKKLSEVGKTMSTAITAPILGIAGVSAKTAISFEAAMSNVEAISRATGDELKSLEDKAKEMGEKTSKSAKESADALGYMALAGWDTQQMLEGLEPVLRASEAGNIDLATCSDLVTDSMSSLSLQVSDLGKYLDVVAMTQNSANSTMQGMLEAYNEVGGTFSNLNVSLEEGATWLGVLANRSLKGSEAGNSLNSLLVNLTGGSSTAANAMQELGVSAWDANGNFKGIEETLRTLQGALANCTQEQKTNFESAIGGKTQLTTLQKMLSGLGTEYGSLKQEITNCDGALIRTAETMQNNTQGNITKFKSKLESVANSIGEILLPTINNFLDKVTVVLNWFGNLDDKTKKIIVTIGGVAAAIGPALIVIGKIATGVSAVVKAGKLLKTALAGIKLASFLNPTTIAITAGIAAVVLLIKNWDWIKEKAGQLKEWLSKKWEEIKTSVVQKTQEIVNGVTNFFLNLPTNIGYAIGRCIGEIVEFGIRCKAWVTNELPVIIDSIVNWFAQLPTRILTWLTNTVSNIGIWAIEIKAKASIAANNLVNTVVDTVKSLPSKIMEIGKNIISGLWEGIQSKWNWLKDKVSNFCSGFTNGIKDAFQIHSPSRVMRDEVGKYLAQGIGVGFDDEMGKVDLDISKSLTSTINATGITAKDLQGLKNSTTSQPTVLYVTNNTYLDGKLIATETTKQVVNNISRQQNSRNLGKGRLGVV